MEGRQTDAPPDREVPMQGDDRGCGRLLPPYPEPVVQRYPGPIRVLGILAGIVASWALVIGLGFVLIEGGSRLFAMLQLCFMQMR